MSSEHEIIKVRLDLTSISDIEEVIWEIESTLKKYGITDAENLVYTGVKGTKERIKQLLKKGIVKGKDSTYAHTAEEIIIIEREAAEMSAINYASSYDNPLLVVYDKQKLRKGSYKRPDGSWVMENEYQPIEGISFREALVALIRLEK